MPPRLFTLAILGFWLATAAWLFHREFWPHFRRGAAPPFSIDLAYEAQRNASAASWSVFRGKERLGYIHTWVTYSALDDTFELHSGPPQGAFQHFDFVIGPLNLRVSTVKGMYRVTREGELREMEGRATVDIQGTGFAQLLKAHFHVEGGGKVKQDQFVPYAFIEWEGRRQDLELEPVPFSSHISILNPMHPVSRITGLRRGQQWQQTLVNPLGDSVAAMAQKNPALQMLVQRNTQVKVLQAEVLAETQALYYEQRQTPCLVIEFRGEDFLAHTWVRESDGKVLKQEATLYGERLVLERL